MNKQRISGHAYASLSSIANKLYRFSWPVLFIYLFCIHVWLDQPAGYPSRVTMIKTSCAGCLAMRSVVSTKQDQFSMHALAANVITRCRRHRCKTIDTHPGLWSSQSIRSTDQTCTCPLTNNARADRGGGATTKSAMRAWRGKQCIIFLSRGICGRGAPIDRTYCSNLL